MMKSKVFLTKQINQVALHSRKDSEDFARLLKGSFLVVSSDHSWQAGEEGVVVLAGNAGHQS